MKQIFLIAFFTVAVFSALRQGAAQEADRLRFNQHVRPILSQNCFPCHGFDAKQRKGDLRLDIPESAFADHGGTFPIKPGDLSQSELWTRITSADEDLVMPPPSSNKSLSDAEKQLLRVWIEQGAPYQKHWAFEPPTQTAEPDVKNPVWSRNGVDRFVLQRLEHRGLAPQPEADKETLVRRVAFAITGLPPTVSEVDEFLVDESANAYESMVERYLRSPRYGEEMARHWLDVARYADTHGLHLDNERQMWRTATGWFKR